MAANVISPNFSTHVDIMRNSMFSVRKQYYSIIFSAQPKMNCWLGHSSFTIPNSVCFLSVKRL